MTSLEIFQLQYFYSYYVQRGMKVLQPLHNRNFYFRWLTRALKIFEVRLLTSVWAHDFLHSGKIMENMRHNVTARFGKAAPPKKTILRW